MASSEELPHSGYTFDDALIEWTVPRNAWLESNKDKQLDGIATGCVVFNLENKVLLVQRVSTDSFPDKWEVPGGAVDEEDTTILSAAARELWEESHLIATRFTHIVPEGEGMKPGLVFPNRNRTRWWCRFAFIAEVNDHGCVQLDPREHQDYAWASLEEVEQDKIGERTIPMTTTNMKATIIEAFRLKGISTAKT
jgi:8-oxo-dGTP pyrophosphatase MutT (NUDIX family)